MISLADSSRPSLGLDFEKSIHREGGRRPTLRQSSIDHQLGHKFFYIDPTQAHHTCKQVMSADNPMKE